MGFGGFKSYSAEVRKDNAEVRKAILENFVHLCAKPLCISVKQQNTQIRYLLYTLEVLRVIPQRFAKLF
jgi:hypothetical protein